MRPSTTQNEILKSMVKWDLHYAGIEEGPNDWYGMTLSGEDRQIAWRTIKNMEQKGLIMKGPLHPVYPPHPAAWDYTFPSHYITTALGQQLGEALLKKSGEERVPVNYPWWLAQ